jgi:hypothetical protein
MNLEVKLLEGNIGEGLYGLGLGKDFLPHKKTEKNKRKLLGTGLH